MPIPLRERNITHFLSILPLLFLIVYNIFIMDLSIIIISFNTKELTEKCLGTIFESLNSSVIPAKAGIHGSPIKSGMTNFEVIVLDNNSSDGSVEMLERWSSGEIEKLRSRGGEIELSRNGNKISFKTIFLKENLGFSRGNNEAIKSATGKYLLFLNSDTEVLDDAISSLYSFFTSTQNSLQFVGAKLLEKDRTTSQPSAGHFYTLPVVFASLYLRGDYYGLTRFSPTTIKKVDWVSGACFMCTKENFEKLGGFDEKIFMYMEEIDLFYRACKNGLNVGFYPASQFIHLEGSSSGDRTNPILRVYSGFLYFYKKHHSMLQFTTLRSMLQLKAVVAFAIGIIINNSYLKRTYGEAFKITTRN